MTHELPRELTPELRDALAEYENASYLVDRWFFDPARTQEQMDRLTQRQREAFEKVENLIKK